MVIRITLPLLAILAASSSARAAQESAKPWERMAVIGASASAGFGVKRSPDSKENIPLASLCEAMILKKHEPVRDLSDESFFLAAGKAGADQVAKALEAKPTAVLAVDFLFWFAYGRKKDETRTKDLEAGLELLGKFSCPVVLSGLSDMSEAVGGMLKEEQVPSRETLQKLNARIEAWARTRKNVVIIPLLKLFEAAKEGTPIKVGKTEWKEKPLETLLQKDHLHPTVEGLALIAALCLEELQKSEGLPADAFDLDAKMAVDQVLR